MRQLFYILLLSIITILPGCKSNPQIDFQESEEMLLDYHAQLRTFRTEFREVEQPDVRFFLFGMGNRQKFIYREGKIIDAQTGATIRQWEIIGEKIIPNNYAVLLTTKDSKSIAIFEDEDGVWIQEQKTKRLGKTRSPVRLPDFSGHKYSEILKVLHQEILINILESKPLPNYFVYNKPWRRDAAMMAMCLEATENSDLIKKWVLDIDHPYDHNNRQRQRRPESEADNLGQTLYLISLFSDSSHPAVSKIIKETKRFEKENEQGIYIQGRSDFHFVPVYQTKWLKFGLQSLGMKDMYTIPEIGCDYSSLFWWGYKNKHVAIDEWRSDRFPYLGWARDHFYRQKSSPISNRDYPLTWETGASQADISGMAVIDSIYVKQNTSAPHTWHAAEVFLYLLDEELNNSS